MSSSAQTSTQGALAYLPIRFRNFQNLKRKRVACSHEFSGTLAEIQNMAGYTTRSKPTDIAERDRAAIYDFNCETRKKRKIIECYSLRNGKDMKRMDTESMNVELTDRLKQYTDRLKQYGQGPASKLRPGQSVLQWWAAWMNGADTERSAPRQYNRKNRPAWYSGEIVAGPSKAPIGFVYAGLAYKDDVYTAY
jgi:hypothetical protein